MNERWKPIDTVYSASNLGRVKNKRQILKQYVERGRLYVSIRSKPKSVARLVLLAWRGPSKFWAVHKDGTPDCRLSNLTYREPSAVIADSFKRGRTTMAGTLNGQSKLTAKDVRAIVKLKGKMTQSQIGKLFKVSRQTVCGIYHGRTWQSVTRGKI